MKSPFYLLLPVIALITVSCSSNNPTTRIEKNPEIFRKLSTTHQALAEGGEITKGMSPEAVYIAWGRPDNKTEGQDEKKRYQQWTYNSLSPVFVNNVGFGYGRGFGRGRFGRRGFGRRGFHGGGGFYGGGFYNRGYGGFGSSVAYVSRPSSYVRFSNGKVDTWQRGDVR